jgi:tetratricopeptide (TPR) repeat protein
MRYSLSWRLRHHARPSSGTVSLAVILFLVVATAIGGMPSAWLDRVHAQATEVADPFAEELHPLRRQGGDQRTQTPLPAVPAKPPTRPSPLPVPFPEAAATPFAPSGSAAAADGYLQQALEARRRGDLEQSVELCSRGLAIEPDHAELLLRRGIAWFHLGMFGIASEDFADAAAIAYDDPRPELWHGLTAVERGRPLEAVSAYSEAIRRDRTYLLAYLNRGLAYLHAGEAAKAERDFDHAIRHDPRDARAWFHRGVAATRQRRLADAVRSYETALRLDPAYDPARRNLAALRGRGAGPAVSSRR